jgi:hypothetical protein
MHILIFKNIYLLLKLKEHIKYIKIRILVVTNVIFHPTMTLTFTNIT